MSAKRVVSPPLEELAKLRTPLTPGERKVLDHFLRVLPTDWEIYLQPHLNGLRPDIVLLHPKNGIGVYEIKDWDFGAMDYFVQEREERAPVLMARRNGKTFSVEKQNPVTKVRAYREEIYNLYCPRLPTRSGFGAIITGVVFPFAKAADAEALLHPFREHYGHAKYPKHNLVIGADTLESGRLWSVLPSAYKLDRERMSDEVAADLRHWLVEPEFSAEQRRPLQLEMTPRQRKICLNTSKAAFRRVRGPAGSGKSLVLAGRAAQLAMEGKRVLIVTFNITLINYLMDLAVRYARNGKVRGQIDALNFHYWCKRVALQTGHMSDYNALWSDDDHETVIDSTLSESVNRWVEDLCDSERWDAVLVDEGQDFKMDWWTALRKALRRDGRGEGLLCADRCQNVYRITPWTEKQMPGAGFHGQWLTLDTTYRMPTALCGLAKDFLDAFMPEVDNLRPNHPQTELNLDADRSDLKWLQTDESSAANACVEAIIEIVASSRPAIAYSDLVCIVDNDDVGLAVVKMLAARKIASIHTFGVGENEKEKSQDSRRKKMAFYKGDARVKVTTLHSFKGWESKALVVQISRAVSADSLALAYAGITRLKLDANGCYLTVVNTTRELAEYGRSWPVHRTFLVAATADTPYLCPGTLVEGGGLARAQIELRLHRATAVDRRICTGRGGVGGSIHPR